MRSLLEQVFRQYGASYVTGLVVKPIRQLPSLMWRLLEQHGPVASVRSLIQLQLCPRESVWCVLIQLIVAVLIVSIGVGPLHARPPIL